MFVAIELRASATPSAASQTTRSTIPSTNPSSTSRPITGLSAAINASRTPSPPGTNPMVTSDTLSRHHTLLIPDLRPTTPAIPGSPAIQPELVIYQLDITVRDNHGEVDSTSRTLRSGILTLALDGDPIDSHDRENNEHYIRSLGMTLTPSATTLNMPSLRNCSPAKLQQLAI